MKLIGAVLIALALTGCALGGGQTVREGAKITLEGVETAQQGLIIYGSLPDCAGQLLICKDPVLWAKIKKTEAAVTAAIVKAQPVLDGRALDNGELFTLYASVSDLKNLISQVQTPWRKPNGS